MIRLIQKIPHTQLAPDAISSRVSLPIDVRVRSRAKVQLDDGRQAGLFLPRGQLIRGGDILKSEEGLYVEVLAAAETVSTATTNDSLLLLKAAYHLGNRHVPLQVAEGFVRYRHDHILDDMLQQMGLIVVVSDEAFEPEAGAYQQQGHTHSSSHSHSHDH